MSNQAYGKAQVQQKTVSGSSPKSSLLQRTCACGQHTIAGGECEACRKTREGTIQHAAASSAPVNAVPPVVRDVLSSPGQPLDAGTRTFMEPRFGLDFSQIPIHSLQTSVPQAKLMVNQPGDVYEQEADQVAEVVMRRAVLEIPVPDNENQAKSFPTYKQSTGSPARAASAIPGVPPVVQTVLSSGGGRPLDSATCAFMEPRFGYDFSRVRVHVDDHAAESADALGASAYTLGQQVVFGRGQFDPVSATGRRLIAHELAHTIQQRGSNNEPLGKALASEREAEGAASQVLDSSAIPNLTPSGLAVACQLSGDIRQIDAEIWFVRQQLQVPGSPLREYFLARLQQLELRHKQLLSGGASHVSRPQSELNKEAVRLGEQQAKRRLFFDSTEAYSPWFVEAFLLSSEDFRNKLIALDIYWDKSAEGFRRDPRIDIVEREVMDNDEARGIYNRTEWDRVLNKPAEKSWFDDVIGFVCKYTNPCHDTMEQFHKDLESGMTRQEAIDIGLFELALLLIPGGPEGPRITGKGRPPGGMPFELPAFETSNLQPEPPPAPPKPAVPVESPKLAGTQAQKPATSPPEMPKPVEEPKAKIEAKDPEATAKKSAPDEEAASKARGKAKVEAAKVRTKAKIDDVKERKTQILVEIDEATQRGKQRLSNTQRAELDREKADLAREYRKAIEEENELRRQYNELEISQYERARAFSYSDTAAKEIVGRSGGLDEMSGKKPSTPSIDHVVSIEEMSSFEGFDDLVLEDLRAVLSRTDNLRLMEKALNSSKSGKRWANWVEGRRYGEVMWQQMVELESRLRRLIQDDIKARVAKRHR